MLHFTIRDALWLTVTHRGGALTASDFELAWRLLEWERHYLKYAKELCRSALLDGVARRQLKVDS